MALPVPHLFIALALLIAAAVLLGNRLFAYLNARRSDMTDETTITKEETTVTHDEPAPEPTPPPEPTTTTTTTETDKPADDDSDEA